MAGAGSGRIATKGIQTGVMRSPQRHEERERENIGAYLTATTYNVLDMILLTTFNVLNMIILTQHIMC